MSAYTIHNTHTIHTYTNTQANHFRTTLWNNIAYQLLENQVTATQIRSTRLHHVSMLGGPIHTFYISVTIWIDSRKVFRLIVCCKFVNIGVSTWKAKKEGENGHLCPVLKCEVLCVMISVVIVCRSSPNQTNFIKLWEECFNFSFQNIFARPGWFTINMTKALVTVMFATKGGWVLLGFSRTDIMVVECWSGLGFIFYLWCQTVKW